MTRYELKKEVACRVVDTLTGIVVCTFRDEVEAQNHVDRYNDAFNARQGQE